MRAPGQSRTSQAQDTMQQGTYSAAGQKLDFPLYDSQFLLSTVMMHRYFTAGIGKPTTTGVNKTLADTNMVGEGIPSGWHFTCKALKVIYNCHALAVDATILAIYNLYRNSVVTFKIEGIDRILQLTLGELAGMNFQVINVPTVAGNNINAFNFNIIRAAYPLNIPIILAAHTRFEMDLSMDGAAGAAALDGDKLTLSMQGVLKRLS